MSEEVSSPETAAQDVPAEQEGNEAPSEPAEAPSVQQPEAVDVAEEPSAELGEASRNEPQEALAQDADNEQRETQSASEERTTSPQPRQEERRPILPSEQLQLLQLMRRPRQNEEHDSPSQSGSDAWPYPAAAAAWSQEVQGQLGRLGVGRNPGAGLGIPPALLAAAAVAAGAATATRDEEGRPIWSTRQFPFGLEKDEEPDEPPSLRQRLVAFIQDPAYQAVVVVMVSIGMGALVHETNQRALSLEIDAWTTYATRAFLVFSASDLALQIFIARADFLTSAANIFDLVVVCGDVWLECLVFFGIGDGGEESAASRLRSLRALRAFRGVRACCGCKELDRMVRRMASALSAFLIALLLSALVVALCTAFSEARMRGDFGFKVDFLGWGGGHLDGEDESNQHRLPAEEGAAWTLEHCFNTALASAQDLLLVVAKALVVGSEIWDIESLSSMDVEQWTATCFLALILTTMIVKTAADARAEVQAAAAMEQNEAFNMGLGLLGIGAEGEDGEGKEPSLEQLRAILFSLADAGNALGDQSRLLRRRRGALQDNGACGTEANGAVAGGQARGSGGAEAAGEQGNATAPVEAEADGERTAAATDEGGDEAATAQQQPRPMRGPASAAAAGAAAGGFAPSRSAAAAAAAAAAGLELTLSAEEMVRAQFAELRREVEREVSWRCGLGSPIVGGGLLESAAEGAGRWLNGFSPWPVPGEDDAWASFVLGETSCSAGQGDGSSSAAEAAAEDPKESSGPDAAAEDHKEGSTETKGEAQSAADVATAPLAAGVATSEDSKEGSTETTGEVAAASVEPLPNVAESSVEQSVPP